MTEVERKPSGEVVGKRKRRPRGRPKGLRINVLPSVQITAISGQLGLSGRILTFRDLQRELETQKGVKVGLGTLERFAKGEEPTHASVRLALGLPAIEKVVACQACGIVHVRPCPKRPRKPSRSRTNWKARASALDGLLRRVVTYPFDSDALNLLEMQERDATLAAIDAALAEV